MSATRTLHFYLDFISSNAYLAWEALRRRPDADGLRLEPVPVLFAGLLEAHGTLGPAEIPAKRNWMLRNTLRKARLLGVPLEPPQHHPFNPLLSLRVASLPGPLPERQELVSGLFRAVWAQGLHVSEPEVVARVATEVGLDGPARVAEAQRPAAKERLRAQTDAAIAAGVFGVPSMIVDGELFWGYDDLPYLEALLEGRDALDPAALERWRARTVAPSAQRRQMRGG